MRLLAILSVLGVFVSGCSSVPKESVSEGRKPSSQYPAVSASPAELTAELQHVFSIKGTYTYLKGKTEVRVRGEEKQVDCYVSVDDWSKVPNASTSEIDVEGHFPTEHYLAHAPLGAYPEYDHLGAGINGPNEIVSSAIRESKGEVDFEMRYKTVFGNTIKDRVITTGSLEKGDLSVRFIYSPLLLGVKDPLEETDLTCSNLVVDSNPSVR